MCLSFFCFFKKTPFVLPQTKVKSCRAYVLVQVFSALIKIVVFITTFTFLCCLFYFVAFSGKMVIQKTQKKNIVLFSF